MSLEQVAKKRKNRIMTQHLDIFTQKVVNAALNNPKFGKPSESYVTIYDLTPAELSTKEQIVAQIGKDFLGNVRSCIENSILYGRVREPDAPCPFATVLKSIVSIGLDEPFDYDVVYAQILEARKMRYALRWGVMLRNATSSAELKQILLPLFSDELLDIFWE